MDICILGWYGTETLGDRSILAGILKVIYDIYGNTNVHIGSLFPFLTQRTFFEDFNLYHCLAPKVNIDCFDVKNKTQLSTMIQNSQAIIMGGGPLMELRELEIIEYAFIKSKKMGKKTIVMGCGIGPLYAEYYKRQISNILSYSDLIILRDKISYELALGLCPGHNAMFFTYDPAIIPIGYYLKNKCEHRCDNRIAVNLREYPRESFRNESNLSQKYIINIIKKMARQYEEVIFVPMHTFSVGGDDRRYLAFIQLEAECSNVKTMHVPMNLLSLFGLFYSCGSCVGMRYHSVVFQTLLNGNNAVIDYTEPGTGKISGFLKLLGTEFYKSRYINIQTAKSEESGFNNIINDLNEGIRYKTETDIYTETEQFYKEKFISVYNYL